MHDALVFRRVRAVDPSCALDSEVDVVVEGKTITRVGPRAVLYRFTIDDASTWAQPWTGEYTWPSTDERLYEYACHEANYALGDILRGARLREADARKK